MLAVEEILREIRHLAPAERRRVAAEAMSLVSEDLRRGEGSQRRSYARLLALAGTGAATGAADVGEHHDQYLADAIMTERTTS